MRIDLDDATLARLTPIARRRYQTIQELLADLAREYAELEQAPGRAAAYCPGCRARVPGPFRRGLCTMHYMRLRRAAAAG